MGNYSGHYIMPNPKDLTSPRPKLKPTMVKTARTCSNPLNPKTLQAVRATPTKQTKASTTLNPKAPRQRTLQGTL